MKLNKRAQVAAVTLLVAFAILAVGAFLFTDEGITGFTVYIDKEVGVKLDSDEEVSVIVMLKDDSVQEVSTLSVQSESPKELRKRRLEAKKAMIRKKQDKVLSRLDIAQKDEGISISSDVDLKLGHKYSTVNAFSGKLTRRGFEKLRNDPDVERIYFNGVFEITLDESIPLVDANDVWGLQLNGTNITGAGETVCVIDTGIDTDHSAFTGRILDEYCYCSSPLGADPGCCPDGNTTDDSAEDDHGHGTHCAGIAASADDTYRGVAPDANIIAIKVCNNSGSCKWDDINAGIDRCTDNATKYNISAISISIGGGKYTSYCNSFSSASWINTAVGQGMLVAIASGNNGYTDGISAPACVENATPVGAVYDDNVGARFWSACTDLTTAVDMITCFTNRDDTLDILAPGAMTTSSINNGGFGDKGGTSMATPHVAGAAALMKQLVRLQNGGYITPQEIEDVLNTTGKRIYDSGSSRTYSRIDVYATIQGLDTTPPNVTFVAPDNNTATANISVMINVSVYDQLNNISSCLLEWNYTNESMTKVGSDNDVYCSKTKSIVGSGIFYFRVHANDTQNNFGVSELRQINITNTAPNITGFYPSITEFSIAEPDNQTFNITYEDVNNDAITISWYKNGTLVSSSDNYTFYGNYSTAGFYNITAIISDGTLTDYQAWNFTVNNTNLVPTVANVTITSTDSLNRTSGTLMGSWDFSDIDGDSQQNNETRWYNNTNEIAELRNLTSISSGNTSKNDIWLFSVRVYDGYGWSAWVNSTNLTIQNTVPEFIESLTSQSANFGELFTYDVNCSDIDNDALTYYINNTMLSINETNGIINDTPTDQEIGAYAINVTCGDGELNASQTFDYTVTDATGPTFSNAINYSVDFKRYSNFTANITINDNELSHYIFSTNITGWQNDSAVSISGLAEYNASVSKNISLSQGNVVCWYYWANDTSGNENASNTHCFTVANTAPQVRNVTIDSTDNLNRTNGTLIGLWDISDPDGDQQTDNETKWYNNSVEVTSLRNLTSINFENTTKYDNWTFSVRVYDGYDWSNWYNSSILTIQNTAPTTPAVDLNPDVPGTSDNLWCNVTTQSTDVDPDTIQYYYKWYKGGNLNRTTFTTQLYDILGSGNTSNGEHWNCTVIPYDGTANGTMASDAITVNNPPAAENASIDSTDNLNRTNGTLTATWDFSDSDGHTQQNNETKWYNNSVEVILLRNLTSVGFGNTTKNQNWSFSVRVYDGYDWSSWSNSGGLIIQNTAPAAPVVDLNPDTPQNSDNLWCNVTTQSNDIDLDNTQYYYKWYSGANLNRITLTTQLYDILGSGNTTNGEEWNCTVIPYDGIVNGTAASDKVTIGNEAPEAQNVTITSTDNLNRTNGTLQGTWTFYDADNNAQQNNETRWYNDSVEVTSLRNLTTAGSGNTSKNDVWVFSVRVYDSANWSVWVNSSSLTIQNTAVVLQTMLGITVNETQLINITANAADPDNEALTYDINDSRFTKTDNHFTWQTDLTDSGVYVVVINVTDGSSIDSQNVTVTVLDAVDFDNDGNPDFNDTDDDNDGIDDTSDYLTGDLTDINSTITLKLRINGSESTTQIFNETLLINITDANDNSLVEFNWSFDTGTLVVDWTIDYDSTAGTIRIADMDLTSQGITKTVYINQSSSSYNYVCISDVSDPPASLPSDCSGYTKVACSGSSGQYTCTDLGDTYKVSGLDHSIVSGIQYTPPSDGDGDDGGGGGGGGPAGGFGYGVSAVKKTVLRLDLVPDEIYRIELDLAGLALTHNYFSINKSLPQVKLIMEMVDEGEVELPLRNAYQHFRITAEGMTNDDLKNAELEFRISKDWLELRDYDENLVALNVYDGAWRKLQVIHTGTIDNELYFLSNTDQFGYFAITSEPKVTPPPVREQVFEAVEEVEEVAEAPIEEKRKTWREWLPVITISRHKYLILIGLVVLAAAIITVYIMVSRIKHPYPELSRYIKLSLDKGKNKNKIKKELVDSGWPENMVNDELKKYKKKNE